MIIEFNDNLLTGNSTIDTQHKELIGRIAAFVSSCEEGDGKMKAIKMLDYLAEYTEFHFSEEEKLQQEVSYPGFKEHKEKHVNTSLFCRQRILHVWQYRPHNFHKALPVRDIAPT